MEEKNYPVVGMQFTRCGSTYRIREIWHSLIYFVDVNEPAITGIYEPQDFRRDVEDGSTKIIHVCQYCSGTGQKEEK